MINLILSFCLGDYIVVITIFIRMVRIASGRLQRGMAQGLKYSDAWNESSCDWETAANVRHRITGAFKYYDLR